MLKLKLYLPSDQYVWNTNDLFQQNEVSICKPFFLRKNDNSIHIVHLNKYFPSQQFTDDCGFMKCSVHGPDVINVNKLASVKAFVKAFNSRYPNKKNEKEQNVKVTENVALPTSSLLYHLHCIGVSHPKVREEIKIMPNQGATLVLIEGPTSMLSDYEDLEVPVRTRKKKKFVKETKKPYLVPHASDALTNKGIRSFRQRFHVIEPCNIFRCDKTTENEIHDVNSFDQYVSQGTNDTIHTTCYDLECYPNGLIFCFRENQMASEMTIKEEHVLDSHMQHNEIYEKFGGVVVSEWFRHDNILHVDSEAVKLMHTVYGEKGFGDRSCAKCLGTNIYNGERHTEALVGNPL